MRVLLWLVLVRWGLNGERRLNKENIPSRAYIAFKNEETLATFSREYDGHVFRDKAGEYGAPQS